MTAIPAATEEDFKLLLEMEAEYQSLARLIERSEKEHSSLHTGQSHGDLIDESMEVQAYIRLLSHYQRENERLARQRDVLRQWIGNHCQDNIEYAKHVLENLTGSEWVDERGAAQNFIDALSGEGGAG